MRLRRICCLLLILYLFVGAIGIVRATTQGLNVEAGKEFVYKINVAQKDLVHLSFVALGQADGNLSFSMAFPNSTVIDFGELDQYSTSFTSDIAVRKRASFGKTFFCVVSANRYIISFLNLKPLSNLEFQIFHLNELPKNKRNWEVRKNEA